MEDYKFYKCWYRNKLSVKVISISVDELITGRLLEKSDINIVYEKLEKMNFGIFEFDYIELID
jgi:hypothetical protein